MNTQDTDRVGPGMTIEDSWQNCGATCSATTDCAYWTWHRANSGTAAYKCRLMRSYGRTNYDSNCISGESSCTKEAQSFASFQSSLHSSLYGKVDDLLLGQNSYLDALTVGECAVLCHSSSECTAFTFISGHKCIFAL